MTAIQPKSTRSGKVYRAKVTGRHAITLPAELCRQLGVEVGDSVELEVQGDKAEIRLVRDPKVLPLSQLRGILRPLYRDWEDIQQHIKELRDEWDDHPEPDDVPVWKRVEQ